VPSSSVLVVEGALACQATPPASSPVRIAVYEEPGAAPRVEEIHPAPIAEFIESIASRVHQLTGEAGGNLPYTVVREVAENLIHAGFAEPVISILDGGSTVRFADQGPGISEKERAILPGYTTASGTMKTYIRGVGSGFPIVRDFLSLSGGALAIEDNLGCGSVVTISSRPASRSTAPADEYLLWSNQLASRVQEEQLPVAEVVETPRPRLTTRQTQVLALVLESGSAGPSLVAKELSVGLSTAYRDLAHLEELGLIEADNGKRTVTEQGLSFLDELITR
jgi:DNA-binding MarR family transcriptional regulator